MIKLDIFCFFELMIMNKDKRVYVDRLKNYYIANVSEPVLLSLNNLNNTLSGVSPMTLENNLPHSSNTPSQKGSQTISEGKLNNISKLTLSTKLMQYTGCTNLSTKYEYFLVIINIEICKPNWWCTQVEKVGALSEPIFSVITVRIKDVLFK